MRIICFFSFIFCFLSCTVLVHAQREGNVWYFGTKAGITFNTSPPSALTDGALSTNEGCATICDKNGKLLFYTDGIKVWNRNHKIMPNGNGLAGDPSSTQSAIIVPKPLFPNIYYVFTVDKEAQPKGFQSSEVDMTLDNGLGDVNIKNHAITAPVSEKLTAVQHANKIDIWVIVHDWNSDAFKAYLVTDKGISTNPVVSKTGYMHSGDPNYSIGYLKASSNGRYLASTITRKTNNFELFDFDNNTGTISRKLAITGIENPYGIEFSSDVSKLYTGNKSMGLLYQIDLNAGTPSDIDNSKTLIADVGTLLSISALQLAPDGKIYVSRAGSTKLSVINQPNLKGINCNYDPNGIDLKGRSCQYGLPTFIQSFFIPVTGFDNDPPCVGIPLKFSGYSNTIPDSWQWSFGDLSDSNSSTQQNVTHTFARTGRFRVALVIGKGGIYDTIVKYIDVQDKPKPQLGNDMLRCTGEKITLDAGIGSKYTWNTGDTVQTIQVTQSGKYWVQVSNLACIGSDTVNISFFNKEDLMLGNDTTVCEGSKVILRSKVQGAKYLWNNGSRDSAISVSQSGDYWLQTVVGECTVIDTVHVSFIPPPQVYLGPDSIFCEGDAFMLDAKNTGAAYKWSTGEETQTILVQKSGTYWVNISVGNCIASDTVRYYPCRANLIVPNAFSPGNLDSLNDYFHVFGTDIYNAELTITNRWGEIIFQTHDIYKGWDGKFKGKKSPVGQYFWSLHYWEYEGTILYPKLKKGHFLLIY